MSTIIRKRLPITLNKRTAKLLDKFLEDPERIVLKDAEALLFGLGFTWRRSHGAHNKFQHPTCAANVTFGTLPRNHMLWGYNTQQMRRAIDEVLQHIDLIYPEEMKERPPMPALTLMREELEEKVLDSEAKPLKLLNYKHLPDAVCELVHAYKNREITGNELVKLLNESNYRTVTGMKFTANNVAGTLCVAPSYQLWAATKAKQKNAPAILPAPADQPLKPLVVHQPEEEEPVKVEAPLPVLGSINEFMAQIQEVMNENARLKTEVERLQGLFRAISNLTGEAQWNLKGGINENAEPRA